MFVSSLSAFGSTVGRLLKIQLPPFLRDSRGNRLEQVSTRSVQNSDDVRLYLCGPEEIAVQLEWVLQSAGTRRIALEQEQKAHWTHRIHVAGGLTDAGKRTIALLKRVLTLTVKPGLDAAIALDFYKDPTSHEDPNKWKDTGAGSMVNMAKYYGHPDAFNDLVDSLAHVITEHPIYAGTDFIVAAPGHKSSARSFGEQLAEAVAKKVAKPIVRPMTASTERPAAKEREQGAAARSLEGEFSFGNEVAGRALVIVDDVCRSGGTMSAIAMAARDAGAVSVLGLVGAQTMRK
jgi:adenine/guanine phosphoribosyltransferase-like PRPP-binding protein